MKQTVRLGTSTASLKLCVINENELASYLLVFDAGFSSVEILK
jgi:hypothetical protein